MLRRVLNFPFNFSLHLTLFCISDFGVRDLRVVAQWGLEDRLEGKLCTQIRVQPFLDFRLWPLNVNHESLGSF